MNNMQAEWDALHGVEVARDEFCDPEFAEEQRTMVGAAVDCDGLEDGLAPALDELTPGQQLQVVTMTNAQRRRVVLKLVALGLLSEHDHERAQLWLDSTERRRQ